MLKERKKTGRFLKRGSKVLDKVALSDFSFEEINLKATLGMDNADRSIINTRLHGEDDVARAVKQHESLDENLTPNGQQRAVLRPYDFTEEWERDRKRRLKGQTPLFDETEFEFDFAASVGRAPHKEDGQGLQDQELAHANALSAKTAAPPADFDALGSDSGPGPSINSQAEQGHPAASPNQEHQLDQTATSRDQTSDAESLAAESLAAESVTAESPVTKSSQTAAGQSTVADPSQNVGSSTNERETSLSEQAPSDVATPAAETSSGEDFIPVGTGDHNDPEASAAAEYRRRTGLEEAYEKERQDMLQEASAKGYAEGFSHGEEKGEVQVRQNAKELFSKVGELIEEFENLKGEILQNVQQNFYDLCQAMGETLLHREFQMAPNTFADVLRKTIDESVDSDQFKVHVHPEMFERLKALDSGSLSDHLLADDSVADGDFRIDSQLSSIDGKAKKMVSDLLNQADLELFEPAREEKAG